MKGTVKKLFADKGFGFIRPDGSNGRNGELFFHRSACPDFDRLQEGFPVEYEEEASTKGPRATNVQRA